ncbi:MAG: beta-lactamase family protein [Streptosporangiaceae bacterium]|nr:beta-lactamase family protein [Streptosporangiaceae bacterium]
MTNVSSWTIRLHELAERSGVPGAVLGIWADGEEILASCGVLNTATGVEVTTDSLFQIGSITKVWTATMIMQLIEERRLTLDSTIVDVLPEARIGVADLGRALTTRHLLTHTSGLDGDIFTDTGRGDDCIKRYVDELANAPSAFPVGAAYSYCNSGYVLAGRVIEELDGRPWHESLRDLLVGPLGLNKTVTLPEEAILHRAAVGHYHGDPAQTWGLPRSVGPAGLITTSAHDLLAFARLHLDGGITPEGKRLLSHDSTSAMRQPRTRIPYFSESTAIGLGWRISDWNGLTVIGHDGGTIGQSAYLRIAPEPRLAVCLLTNASEAQALYEALFAEAFREVAGITMPAGPQPAVLPGDQAAQRDMADRLDAGRHAGRYERTARRYDVTVADGLPRATVTTIGQLSALVGPQPEDVFLYPADSTGINFVCRSSDEEPWTPVSFGQLDDGTPYLFASGRIALKTGAPQA